MSTSLPRLPPFFLSVLNTAAFVVTELDPVKGQFYEIDFYLWWPWVFAAAEERGSSCRPRGLLSAGASPRGAQARQAAGSGAEAHGLAALRRVGSSQIKGGPRPLLWRVDLRPLYHHWNPRGFYLIYLFLFLL